MTEQAKSKVLPTDPFDLALDRLIGLPDGAYVKPSMTQAIDFYGNVSSFMVQTVKAEQGVHVFVTEITAAGSKRYMIPPPALALMNRQQDAISLIVRRRHGKRLAEAAKASGRTPTFTPAMRAKGLATRKARAAKRRARKASRS